MAGPAETFHRVKRCSKYFELSRRVIARNPWRSRVSDFEIVQQRAEAFYDRFDRKADLQGQTHYCPGCGHGIIHKLIARAIDQLDVKDRTVLVSPVGCSVFAYYYFDV